MGPAGLLLTMRAIAQRLRRRGGLAGAMVTHRSRTRLAGLGVVGSAWLLVQRSSARCRWRQRVRRAGSRQREQNRQKAVDATKELNEIIRSASLEPAEGQQRLAAGSSGYTDNRSGDLQPLTRLVVRSR
jgi:hypothetical protein